MGNSPSPAVDKTVMIEVKKYVCHEDLPTGHSDEFCDSTPSKWKKNKNDKVRLSDLPGEEVMCNNFVDWYKKLDCGTLADKIKGRLEEIVKDTSECKDLSEESKKHLTQEMARGKRARGSKKVLVELPAEQTKAESVKKTEKICRTAIENDSRIGELAKLLSSHCNGFDGATLMVINDYCTEKTGGINWWLVGGLGGGAGALEVLRRIGKTTKEAGEALEETAKGISALRKGFNAIGKHIGDAARGIKNGAVYVGKGIAKIWNRVTAKKGKTGAPEEKPAESSHGAETKLHEKKSTPSPGMPLRGTKRTTGPILTPAPRSANFDLIRAAIGDNLPQPGPVLAQMRTYLADTTNFEDGNGEVYRRRFFALGPRGQTYLAWWAIHHWNQIPESDRDLAMENAKNRGFGELPKPVLTEEFIPNTLTTAERMIRIKAQAEAFNKEVLKPRGLEVGTFKVAASNARQGVVNFGAGMVPFAAAQFFSDVVWHKPHQSFAEFARNYGALTVGGSSAKMLVEGAFNLKDGFPFLSDTPFAGEVSSNLLRRLSTRSVSTFAAFALAEFAATGKVDPAQIMETFAKATTVSAATGFSTSLELNGSETIEKVAKYLRLAKRVKQAAGGAKAAGIIGAAALAPEVVPTALGAAVLLAADFVIIDGITVKMTDWRMKKAENEIKGYMQDELIDAVMANNNLIARRKRGEDISPDELMEVSQRLESARAKYEGYVISRSIDLKKEWKEKDLLLTREESEARIEAAAEGNRAMGQVRTEYESKRAELDKEYKGKIAELEGNSNTRVAHALPLSNESPRLSYFQELKIFYTPEDKLNDDHQMRRSALRNNAREPFKKALASNIYSVLDQMDNYTRICNDFWDGEVKKVYLASR